MSNLTSIIPFPIQKKNDRSPTIQRWAITFVLRILSNFNLQISLGLLEIAIFYLISCPVE